MPKKPSRLVVAVAACVALSGALTAYVVWGTGDEPVSAAPSAALSTGGSARPSSPDAAPAPSTAQETSRGLQIDTGAPPKVYSVSPSSGGAAGGERVVIHGESFSRSQVMFGSTAAQVVEAKADELTVVVPTAERAGPVALVITNRSGAYTVAQNAYTYVP